MICLSDARDMTAGAPVDAVCRDIMDSALAALGRGAADVVRIEGGLVCGAPCTDDVIVGFRDGHLEGANVDWFFGDAWHGQPFAVSPFHAVDASAWPWGDSAPFVAPPLARPSLSIPPSSPLASRQPLPYCGLDVADASGAALDPAARECFAAAVRTGHAAEYISRAQLPEEESVDVFTEWVVRFTGSGPVLLFGARSDSPGSDWTTPEKEVIYIGTNHYVRYWPIPPVGLQ